MPLHLRSPFSFFAAAGGVAAVLLIVSISTNHWMSVKASNGVEVHVGLFRVESSFGSATGSSSICTSYRDSDFSYTVFCVQVQVTIVLIFLALGATLAASFLSLLGPQRLQQAVIFFFLATIKCQGAWAVYFGFAMHLPTVSSQDSSYSSNYRSYADLGYNVDYSLALCMASSFILLITSIVSLVYFHRVPREMLFPEPGHAGLGAWEAAPLLMPPRPLPPPPLPPQMQARMTEKEM